MAYEVSKNEQIEYLQKARQFVIQGNYSQAASFYEQAIDAEPDVKSHYWHLGLTMLLQGQEPEAHTTWLLGMVGGESEEIESWTEELRQVLHTEAERRVALADDSLAWLIRQHIREICPADINNLLCLIHLGIQLEKFTGDELKDWRVIELLNVSPPVEVDFDLLMQTLQQVLNYVPLHPSSLELVQASLAHVRDNQAFLIAVFPAAMTIAYSHRQPKLAARIAEIYLRLETNNLEVLRQLAFFYQNAGEYEQGIATPKLSYSLSQELPEKVFANYQLIRGLMGAGGYWEQALSACQQQQSLLLSLIEVQPITLTHLQVLRLFNTNYFAPYVWDNPQTNKPIQNRLAQLCQTNIQICSQEQVELYKVRNIQRRSSGNASKPIKIGYLSHCLRQHSVGWLARWLLQYHNRERFEINGYFLNHKRTGETLQEWYISQVSMAYFSVEGREIAEQIYKDEVDILIDLDSITLDSSCDVMALKPAPVQVTWLGWDASGIPAVDYFIADPYVVPESAQDYYTEKIWRLPQTYIAVDGFEVGVPTLRRELLDIPSDAVVYLSSQSGYKRHADTARLQIKILREVPNSYFLIKGKADEDAIKNFFIRLAEEEGVESNRLRFLPDVASEMVHRANLAIADVVLDTYPYNGATTTLETLWMGIPLVTRVGEQFAARNSYTMMMNVGIIEGIAWTDEEYLEWGVRLGKNSGLRQQISWRLRQSRKTSPLWNAKQFTCEIEKAYEQMWQSYLEGDE